MGCNDHILVSLESRHAENILSGIKHVELRRRTMNVAPGSTMWIYVKQPVGSIIGNAIVGEVACLPPSELWKIYGSVSGLSRKEFFEYFDGIKRGIALVLGDRTRLNEVLSLDELRSVDHDFHPPQFFSRLPAEHPLRAAVATSTRSGRSNRQAGSETKLRAPLADTTRRG